MTCLPFGLGVVVAGCAFGAGEVAVSFFLLENGALFGWGLAVRQYLLSIGLGGRLLPWGRGGRAIALALFGATAEGPFGAARSRRRWLVLAVLGGAFELADEGGGGFPGAKRAAPDADRGGRLLLGQSLPGQPRRPLLQSRPLLLAAPLIGELLLRRFAQTLLPQPASRLAAGGGLDRPGGAGTFGVSAETLDEFLGTHDTDVVSCGTPSVTRAAVARRGAAWSPRAEAR